MLLLFIRRHVMLLCPIIGDKNFDQLVKVVSYQYVHSNLCNYPLYLIHNLWGTLETVY